MLIPLLDTAFLFQSCCSSQTEKKTPNRSSQPPSALQPFANLKQRWLKALLTTWPPTSQLKASRGWEHRKVPVSCHPHPQRPPEGNNGERPSTTGEPAPRPPHTEQPPGRGSGRAPRPRLRRSASAGGRGRPGRGCGLTAATATRDARPPLPPSPAAPDGRSLLPAGTGHHTAPPAPPVTRPVRAQVEGRAARHPGQKAAGATGTLLRPGDAAWEPVGRTGSCQRERKPRGAPSAGRGSGTGWGRHTPPNPPAPPGKRCLGRSLPPDTEASYKASEEEVTERGEGKIRQGS